MSVAKPVDRRRVRRRPTGCHREEAAGNSLSLSQVVHHRRRPHRHPSTRGHRRGACHLRIQPATGTRIPGIIGPHRRQRRKPGALPAILTHRHKIARHINNEIRCPTTPGSHRHRIRRDLALRTVGIRLTRLSPVNRRPRRRRTLRRHRQPALLAGVSHRQVVRHTSRPRRHPTRGHRHVPRLTTRQQPTAPNRAIRPSRIHRHKHRPTHTGRLRHIEPDHIDHKLGGTRPASKHLHRTSRTHPHHITISQRRTRGIPVDRRRIRRRTGIPRSHTQPARPHRVRNRHVVGNRDRTRRIASHLHIHHPRLTRAQHPTSPRNPRIIRPYWCRRHKHRTRRRRHRRTKHRCSEAVAGGHLGHRLTRQHPRHIHRHRHRTVRCRPIAQLPIAVVAPTEHATNGDHGTREERAGGHLGHRLTRQHPRRIHRHRHQTLRCRIVPQLPRGVAAPTGHRTTSDHRTRMGVARGHLSHHLTRQRPRHVHRHRHQTPRCRVVPQLPRGVGPPTEHPTTGDHRTRIEGARGHLGHRLARQHPRRIHRHRHRTCRCRIVPQLPIAVVAPRCGLLV